MEVDLVEYMAAHFGFDLISGEYDGASDQVIAQIRWCAMFVIQADATVSSQYSMSCTYSHRTVPAHVLSIIITVTRSDAMQQENGQKTSV